MSGESSKKSNVIVKPIVFGNSAKAFGKKREEDGHTHQWCVYLKPYENDDLSLYVRKVQFKLHESYTNQLRTVTNPPYEVAESGWGEFEVTIKIFFQDVSDRPLVLHHPLKLFQSDDNIVIGKKTIVYEQYDEMIFQDPSPLMLPLLTANRQATLGAYRHQTNFKKKEEDFVTKLEDAIKKVASEIEDCKMLSLKKMEYLKSIKQIIETHEKNESAILYDLDNL